MSFLESVAPSLFEMFDDNSRSTGGGGFRDIYVDITSDLVGQVASRHLQLSDYYPEGTRHPACIELAHMQCVSLSLLLVAKALFPEIQLTPSFFFSKKFECGRLSQDGDTGQHEGTPEISIPAQTRVHVRRVLGSSQTRPRQILLHVVQFFFSFFCCLS